MYYIAISTSLKVLVVIDLKCFIHRAMAITEKTCDENTKCRPKIHCILFCNIIDLQNVDVEKIDDLLNT